MKFTALVATLFAIVSANTIVLVKPPTGSVGTPIGVVVIPGEGYAPQQYQTLAQTFQSQASNNGLMAWVAIPQLDSYKKATTGFIDKPLKQAVQTMQSAGFTGDNLFIAGHNLGGVMSQWYITGEGMFESPDYTFKGQILLGSVMNRQYRSISKDDGTTVFKFPTDTLTIGGTKDGVTRISRVAEAYWHQIKNVNSQYTGKFPVVALEGVSHHQFATGTTPDVILTNDFSPAISESTAHTSIAKYMAKFVNKVLTGYNFAVGDTATILAPLISAIEMEGSYIMKDACYTSDDVNPPSDICLHGSPWMSQYAVKTLVGTLEKSNISIEVDDNFHRSSTVYPYHHPHITSDCASAGSTSCTIKSISNSMLEYDSLSENKITRTAISASEIRGKMKSNQAYRIAAGEDVDSADAFAALDQQGDECQRINQAAFDWALKTASKTARSNYNNKGEPMVMIADTIQGNGGLWIDEGLKMKETGSEFDVSGVACPISEDNFVEMFQGMHYCKLLSPFRAMEWIYVDGLYMNDTIAATQSLFLN